MNDRPTPSAPARECTSRLRVRYDECDPMGVAHHSSYVPWLEIGRTELLRSSGVSYAALEREGVLMVIVKLEVAYRRPVKYDDVVEVRTAVVGGSRVKIEHRYEVSVVERESETGLPFLAAAARTTLACVGREGKVRELPGWLVKSETET